MKTSCFFTYEGPGRISIARFPPSGIKGCYRAYPALAPRHNMLKMGYEQYRPQFFAILEALDPERVVEELTALAEPYEPVLLCYERPTTDRYQLVPPNVGRGMVRARASREGPRDFSFPRATSFPPGRDAGGSLIASLTAAGYAGWAALNVVQGP